jgi:aldose 1-epimerase
VIPAREDRQRIIRSGDLTVRVGSSAILSADYRGIAFLVAAGGPDGTMANFPLVPFGNRVEHNALTVAGKSRHFTPNSSDPLYLHGDGWLSEWEIANESADRVALSLRKAADERSPYTYHAEQTIAVSGNELSISLSVCNMGEEHLPFGIGQHPFFVRTPATILRFAARSYWSEREGHLPDRNQALPPELDFYDGAMLPRIWVNNAFEGWDGEAAIEWPELGLQLALDADPVFDVGMVYMPTDRTDFFCFEPMSHLPNGHHLPDFGGLRLLAKGESLQGTIRLRLATI